MARVGRQCSRGHRSEQAFITRIQTRLTSDDASADPQVLHSKSLLENAITRLGLSARAYDRILKVSRTLADFEGKENIEPGHVSEAIQYR
jgi:predicted ATPase with chaperone activity